MGRKHDYDLLNGRVGSSELWPSTGGVAGWAVWPVEVVAGTAPLASEFRRAWLCCRTARVARPSPVLSIQTPISYQTLYQPHMT